MKKKILISDKVAEEGIAILTKSAEFDVVYKTGLSEEDLIKEIRDASGLIIRSATKANAKVIEAAEKLQVIARAGVGLDNVDLDKATAKGIVVMNTPAGNTISTAEQAIAMLFALARKTAVADASMKKGEWEKKLFQGTELRGKTIAVIGLGRIGMEVAKRCKAMAMRVVGYDPFIAREALSSMDIEVLELDEIWREADFITVHTPLTDQTRDLVNKDVIKKLKPTVKLINCARGGIYNEQDLFDALKEKKIAGAALDVFTQEPPKTLPPFHELDNIVLTPHLGASTDEAQIAVAVEAAENVAEYLLTGVARNSANFPSLEVNEYNVLKPYIELVEKMGALQGALMEGGIKEVSIYYTGVFGNYNLSPLTSSYLKGLMSSYTDATINFVNAPFVAKERGLKVQIGEDQASRDYSHLIIIRVKGDGGENELWGTVIGSQPWIVKFNEYLIDFIPAGKMLIMHNNDVPNVVGSIGSFLGKHGINIANLHLARTKRGGKALVIIEIDDELGKEIVEEMAALPEIIDLKHITV